MTRRLLFLTMWVVQTLGAATVTFNGGVTYQTIDGFGANINHRSWTNDDLKPVIDALVDQAGMTLFRVIYDKTDWEAANENASPYVMNWSYYDAIYSSPEFEKMWGLVGYLNQKGISNGVMFNFQGNGPAWLGVPALNTGMEPEWAQMVASLLIYARQTNQLQFGLVGPDNEMDQTVQGVNMTASQYVTALHDLSQLLDTNGMSDLKFVGPDLANASTTFMSQMLADPVVMSKVAHFGLHSYAGGGGGSAGVASYIQSSAYPDRTVWMTEFNVWCASCDAGVSGTDSWSFASGAVAYLSGHLANGATAGLVWEGYDSQYNYYNPGQWDFFGLFAVDDTNAVDKTYTPRKIFYTLSQVSKWVRPGAQMIGVTGSTSSFSPLMAFNNTGLGQITIVGINTSGSAATLNGALVSLPTVPYLDLYYTSATTNLADGGSVAVNNGTFSATIPANCVFTLTGFTGVNVRLTNPVNGAQFNAPATIPLAATATSTAGSIALVGFYNGATELGEATSAPYGFTWNNVPMGNYALTALAGDTVGNVGTSAVVNVTVVGPLAQIGVTPANATVAPGGQQQFSATGADLLGHTLLAQPTLERSVSGGGTLAFAASAQTNPIAGSWTLVFDDEFNGTTLNTNLWNPSGFVDNPGLELETYYATNVVVTNGLLQLWAYNPSPGVYTSGKVTTMDKFWQRYGYFEASVNVPRAVNLWPAFWNLKEPYNTNDVTEPDWPPEVDILEVNPTGGGAVTYYSANIARGPNYPLCGGQAAYWDYVTGSVSDLTTGFHTIGYLWTSAGHSFYVDGTLIGSSTAHPFTLYPTWFILQNAIKPSPSGLPAAFQVDYVRFWATNGMLPPIITSQPSTQTVVINTPATFSVTCTNALSYQWTMAGTNVTGATSSTWTYTPSAVQTQLVSVVVTNAYGGIQSGFVQLQAQVQSGPLAQIGVTPANTTILTGTSQPFTATGTYADGSTLNITGQATWTSSNPAVATITAAGLATGVSAGTTMISASLAGMEGVTALTVETAPLGITTASLPGGVVNVGYSGALAASGGTTPYTWSIASGFLPPGLTLNATSGAISGTPTATGAFSFSVQVNDASLPMQTATDALSINVASVPAAVSIWPVTAVPVTADGGSSRATELGVKFNSDVAGTITGIRFYKASANTGTHIGNLWTITGTRLATATFSAESASGWQQVLFGVPVTITSNTVYVASYHVSKGHYSADAGYFSSKGADNPPLHALTNGVSGGNGVYLTGSSSAFPNRSGNGANYWVDVVFNPAAVATLTSIAVTSASSTNLVGATQQFTATGTYSDGSKQNLTSQAAWTSSNTAVAIINASGLATAVSAGSTAISAALAGVTNNVTLTVTAPPTLTSIAVTPANPTILVGASQPFTATGTYSDSSTKNITSQATWTSSSTGVATINASGSATGVSAGGTTISAALAGVSGQTTLTVQAPPTLASIAMTPANPAILVAATQQFTATGTYSDGSTQNLSSQVTWTSSKTAVAAINANGLATGVSAGATVISAALSGVTATNTLTVQAAPLVTTTTSMPTGTVSVAYSATLSATGGTTPYTWAIANGSLPGGLALNAATGALTGTPTNTGTFTFTAQVSDAGSPQQLASNALSITISSAPTSVTIWPSSAVPVTADGGPDSAVELGVKFKSDVAGRVTGIRFYKATANTGTHVGNLWSSAGTKLATATFSGETASGWQQVSFATPVAITSNTVYVTSYHCTVGHYSEDDNYFASKGVDNPPLHALANGVSGGDGVYKYGTSSAFPNQTYNSANYWVDVVFVSP